MLDLVEDILVVASAGDKAELTILHNAFRETSKAYTDNPVSARLKDWQVAKEALTEAIDQMGARYGVGVEATVKNPEVKAGPWRTKSDVLVYLQTGGWDIKKQRFYNHCSEKHLDGGRLRKDKKGGYSQAAVDRYANKYLINNSLNAADPAKEEKTCLQDKKIYIENRLKLAQAKKAEHELEAALGKYLPRDQFNLEMAARAGVLDNGLNHFIQTVTPELITICKGDQSRAANVISRLTQGKEQLLNQYATTEEFHVMIKEDKNEDV